MISSVGGSMGTISFDEMRQQHFKRLDTDEDGTLNQDEFSSIAEKMQLSTEEVKAMFAETDTDGDGALTQSEMDTAMEARMKEHPPGPPPAPRGSEDLVEQLTAAIDSGDDDEISVLLETLKSSLSSYGASSNSANSLSQNSILFSTLA